MKTPAGPIRYGLCVRSSGFLTSGQAIADERPAQPDGVSEMRWRPMRGQLLEPDERAGRT